MNPFWMIVCLSLVLTQLVTLWWGRINLDPDAPPVPLAASADLRALLSDMESLYAEAGRLYTRAGVTAAEQTGAPAVLQREDLLLRLRDLERELALEGAEIRVSLDLESWLASGSLSEPGTEDEASLSAYLQGLMNWMTMAGEGRFPGLSRASLIPGSGSAYPALSFEAGEQAVKLGRILRDFPANAEGWELMEFDLARTADPGAWWMRGSFLYRQAAP